MPPKEKKVYPCIICKKQVTKKSGGVPCNYCEEWVHPKCADITPEYLDFLDKLPGASWTCKPCLMISHKIKQEIKLINVKQAAMREDIDSNKDRIVHVEKRQDEAEASRIADRDFIFEEFQERDNRKDNLVFHQIPEPPESMTRGEERKKYDIQSVINILDFIQCRMNNDGFRFIYRAGERSNSGKPRPIIVSIKDSKAKEYILANSRKLANSRFSNISIVPDLTNQQRRMEENLRKTAENRNNAMDREEASNWEWVLVGMRGHRRLIKRKIIHQDSDHRNRGRSTMDQPSNEYVAQTGLNTVNGATSGRGRGMGKGRGRGGGAMRSSSLLQPDYLVNSLAQPTVPQPVGSAPTATAPAVVSQSSMLLGGEDIEEVLNTQPTVTTKKVSSIDLPSSEDEEEEEENTAQDLETMEEMGTRETRKRHRPDSSKSPPNPMDRKKQAQMTK